MPTQSDKNVRFVWYVFPLICPRKVIHIHMSMYIYTQWNQHMYIKILHGKLHTHAHTHTHTHTHSKVKIVVSHEKLCIQYLLHNITWNFCKVLNTQLFTLNFHFLISTIHTLVLTHKVTYITINPGLSANALDSNCIPRLSSTYLYKILFIIFIMLYAYYL